MPAGTALVSVLGEDGAAVVAVVVGVVVVGVVVVGDGAGVA